MNLNFKNYTENRDQYRDEMLSLKEKRRICGRNYSILFENEATIKYQIYEVLLLEDSYDNAQEEIEAYQDLIPGPDELVVTFMIEISDKKERNQFLCNSDSLLDEIYILYNSQRIYGRRIDREKISCVNFLKFDISHTKKDLDFYIISENSNMSFKHKINSAINA